MSKNPDSGAAGYDKYVNHRSLLIAVGLFVLLLLIPAPSSMLDVAVEYSAGKAYVLDFYTQELFGKPHNEVEQWQLLTARVLEKSMMQGTLLHSSVLRYDLKRVRQMGIEADPEHFARFNSLLRSLDDERFREMMRKGRELRHETLAYEMLSEAEKAEARKAAWQIRVCIAMTAFVVVCFLTEAIPLPGVAFCIGLILVFTGVVGREDVAALFWSDACWFIMGSLMFAAAFVKTGVDKRVCLIMFRNLARPSVRWVTAILILVIAPSAAFISDHALAAMFLPIALILYNNSLTQKVPADRELAKMLMICICMACNIGGFGSPSGGARNVIMMTYMEDMFGITVGYGQWICYGFPFVLIMMPVLWVLLNRRFKPAITNLGPALETLKADIGRAGGWKRQQIIALAIFLVMLLGWITEKNILQSVIGIRLGIGVIAMAGAVAYLLAGVVNWRDYQEKVDWGVVWLYAGAIVLGRTLDATGAAYWLARSVVEVLEPMGLAAGGALLCMGGAVTAIMTNLMADGPAAASVGPITLSMAAVANPGTALVPFMGLITACASSFAYLLVIGTPPNAIVYASGVLEPKDFLRVGIPCLLISFVVLMLLALFYWPLVGQFGLAPF